MLNWTRWALVDRVYCKASLPARRFPLFVSPQMGRLEDAIADFTKALELDPTNASSHNSRGLARDRAAGAASPQLAQSLREGAIADFSAAISLETDNAVFRHNRGFCYR